ncbi:MULTISPECIES: hypothetical protein [unclassified Pantoea]|uniref:hypothetical protein n=1 Tax=unclassified Pantoea TaxID=2630326 RepID=UPI0024775757|nr:MULTISPECIES: hypothetical protein [unclassified Pantoea]GME47326.1 hypothetical protein ACJ3_42850 [Pantoea sp. QMID3]GME47374.1 hypothetical protein ACJ1_42370 [Pantoea sp. QMID1]GME62274.1 hypothetical protein ACJ4_42730 [Pantoea sp. QMID4]GME63594.1 hypothetical protein ACJ2_42840 [Pantoea sp. QMID2]
MNSLTDETTWKIIAAAIPVIASVLQSIRFLINWLKDGSLYKLKKLDKEFSEYLCDSEEKKLLHKRIIERVGSRLAGVNDPTIKKRIIYVLNRSEIRLPPFWANHIGKYLEDDGKRFYFNFTSSKFRKKRIFFRTISMIYMLYAFMIWWAYFHDNILPLWLVLISSISLSIISVFCMGLFPSNKFLQAMNGRIIKVDIKEYRKYKVSNM